LNSEMRRREFIAALGSASADPRCRAVIRHGRAERAASTSIIPLPRRSFQFGPSVLRAV
jgi:hypothetical protein